ncbi:PREDICTED: uncharacterized protein LOC109192682 [Ipomoea nil]|uniref:uncharacterized protein LOC109192682 n=1 Tax=Ipomoea nil TaxID=35883 RepID=UPI000900AF4E|nr:PREDICTED: uncharacterized protein LOC109192682 [Ipomoea nil]
MINQIFNNLSAQVNYGFANFDQRAIVLEDRLGVENVQRWTPYRWDPNYMPQGGAPGDFNQGEEKGSSAHCLVHQIASCIMVAHEMVCGGVRRKIGDGKSTLIWGHPWLPDEPSPLVQTAMPPTLHAALVSGSLLARIMKTHGSGCYSVKSYYRHIVDDYVNHPGDFDKWITLWKLKVPPKWMTFLWRALNDILPTTTNLLLKRVEVSPSCPLCDRTHENTMYSLVLCEFSQLVWNISSLTIFSITGNTFSLWFKHALDVCSEDNLALIMAVLYHLWNAQNSAIWKGCVPLPRRVLENATSSLHAWRQVHSPLSLAAPTITVPVLSSPKLPRCLFDANYHHSMGKAAYGVVLFPSNSVFVAACDEPLPVCSSTLMAESMACKEAMSWLKDQGVLTVDLNTNCSELRRILSSQVPILSYVCLIIDHCRTALSTFTNCTLCLVPRSANIIAHTLAYATVSQANSLCDTP